MAEPAAEIFVIDDDESVRLSLGRLLCSAGYQCQTFASAVGFLDFLRSDQAHRPDACAIVDIHMPGTDGIELMQSLRRTHPALRVVLITASSDEYSRSVSAASNIALLQKPFDDVTLFAAIGAPSDSSREPT